MVLFIEPIRLLFGKGVKLSHWCARSVRAQRQFCKTGKHVRFDGHCVP